MKNEKSYELQPSYFFLFSLCFFLLSYSLFPNLELQRNQQLAKGGHVIKHFNATSCTTGNTSGCFKRQILGRHKGYAEVERIFCFASRMINTLIITKGKGDH